MSNSGYISRSGDAPGFIAARWRGLVSPDRLLFMDMWLVGTGLNLAATFLSLVVLGLKFPLWLSLAVFFSPVPRNLFLVAALWRACDLRRPAAATAYRAAALLWLVLATLI